jgi:hypothetical protein
MVKPLIAIVGSDESSRTYEPPLLQDEQTTNVVNVETIAITGS